MIDSKKTLRFAACLSFAVALFQAVISFSPSLSLYFGAPEKMVAHPPLLLLGGLFMAVVFGVFGLYALSGAGHIRRLPLLGLGLLGIGLVYTLRGLMLILQLLLLKGILSSSETVGLQSLASSWVAFFIGLVYLVGTLGIKRLANP
jgi:hypothetical protein